jgi:DNA-binding LytR/AlgR family response regulator
MNPRRKIMIVEDDTLLCRALVELLEANGYHALPPVHTYEDAKKQLLQYEPDLALIDIGLPGEKDGIQLASYVYQYTQVPVVFITGYTDAVTWQRAKKSHPNSIVLKTKPILNQKTLVDTIGQQLLASILIAAPDEALHIKIKPKGLLLKVNEKKIEPVKTNRGQYTGDDGRANRKTLIPFDDIQYITTNNKETRNTILIKPAGNTAYIYRETMAGIEKELPDYFVKIKDSHIINIKKVTQCIDDSTLFIDNERFDVSESCQPGVHEKKRIYLSHLF